MSSGAFFLSVHPAIDGGWEVAAGDHGRPFANGRLEPEAVAEIIKDIGALLAPPRVSVPGRDAARVQAEERAGRQLARVFDLPGIAQAVAYYRGTLLAHGTRALLVVDASHPAIAGLPWELIGWSSKDVPVASGAGVSVVRLARGPAASVGAGAGELLPILWCPTSDDPTCADRCASLLQLWRLLELRPVVLTDAEPPPSLPGSTELAAVLHIVCHGGLMEGEGVLLGDHSDKAIGQVVALLAPSLPSVALVILEVCSAGSPSQELLHSLAGRLLLTGAPRCIAPGGTIASVAYERFADALYAALCAGNSVNAAMEAGRASLARLAHPHPDHRPMNLLNYATHVDIACVGPPLGDPWRPAGWPNLSSEARAVLQKARRRAERKLHSWIGVEHLLPAMLDLAHPTSQSMSTLLWRQPPEIWERLGNGLVTAPESPPELELTPRMSALGRCLQKGATLAHLWRELLLDPGMGMRWLIDQPLGQGGFDSSDSGTGGPSSRVRSTLPARMFEVLWGPSDGTFLRPEEGQTIGRFNPDRMPDLPIHVGGTQASPLRSRHLKYLGPGKVELIRSAWFLPGDACWPDGRRIMKGELAIFENDIIAMGDAVWLRGIR